MTLGLVKILGPLRAAQGFDLIAVIEIVEARFQEVRGLVEKALFEQWLAQRRHDAQVRWFWGREEES